MMKEELLPCPFCGSSDIDYEHTTHTYGCRTHGCPASRDKVSAKLADWNRRQPSAEVDEARYRYIRSEGTKLHPQILSVTFNAGHDWEHKYSHTDFDAVIDAARARSAKGE